MEASEPGPPPPPVGQLLAECLREVREELGQRLGALERGLASALEESRRQTRELLREREALRDAMEEQAHRIRQEHLKEQAGAAAALEGRLERLETLLRGVAEGQAGAASAAAELGHTAERLREALARPEKAKDHLLQELETEKRDLLAALRERTEQLRAYTIERRDVERTLGESLMDLTRELEAGRVAQAQLRARVASLESDLLAAKAREALKEKEGEQAPGRLEALARQRDEALKALEDESEKLKAQVEARLESDKRWEARVAELQALLEEERAKRLQAEQAAAGLQARIQTLADHLARQLQDREAEGRRTADWSRERQELAAALRKKEEMIAMLSATFQNLLKKPDA